MLLINHYKKYGFVSMPKCASQATERLFIDLMCYERPEIEHLVHQHRINKSSQNANFKKTFESYGIEYLNFSKLDSFIKLGYKLILITRDPYERLLSGICNKFIHPIVNKKMTHAENYESILKTFSPNIANVYKWHIGLGKDIESINFKNILDFLCNIDHKYVIDDHFLPITHTIKTNDIYVVKLEDEKKAGKIRSFLELDENESINNIFSALTVKKINVTKYSNLGSADIETLELNKDLIKHKYYIESVNKKFAKDFSAFDYERVCHGLV